MSFPRVVGACFFLLLPLIAPAASNDAASAFTERTPAYFVDRFGLPKSSHDESAHDFFQPGRGTTVIQGPFSIREYRTGDLRITAVFNLPSLKLAGVKLRLSRPWTPEQISAGLGGYRASWTQ